MTHAFNPIGIIHSPFKEKFGIPRQAGLIPEARARLELLPPYDQDEALRGLAGFSHVWLVFIFHANAGPELEADGAPTPAGRQAACGESSPLAQPFDPTRLACLR